VSKSNQICPKNIYAQPIKTHPRPGARSTTTTTNHHHHHPHTSLPHNITHHVHHHSSFSAAHPTKPKHSSLSLLSTLHLIHLIHNAKIKTGSKRLVNPGKSFDCRWGALHSVCKMSSELRRALTVYARCQAVSPCRIQPALNTLTSCESHP
jgi:hypothetical protein